MVTSFVGAICSSATTIEIEVEPRPVAPEKGAFSRLCSNPRRGGNYKTSMASCESAISLALLRPERNNFGGGGVAYRCGGPVRSSPIRYTRISEDIMIRLTVIAVMLTVSVAPLAISQARAQSPDPALLAPGQSGRMMAPPRYTDPSPIYTSPRPGGHAPSYISQRGAHLSHPARHRHGG
jgi:hypothetical protein